SRSYDKAPSLARKARLRIPMHTSDCNTRPKGDSNMTVSRAFVFLSAVTVALYFGAAEAQPAKGAAPKMVTLQMPATPDPARVTLDPKSTALMVLDYVEDICNQQANCKTKMLPAMTPFMERVRKA